MKMMPIMSKKIQENKADLEKNEKIRVDQTNKEERALEKWEKGKKKKKKLGLLEIGITEISVKYTEIYNPHRL